MKIFEENNKSEYPLHNSLIKAVNFSTGNSYFKNLFKLENYIYKNLI